MATKDIKAVVKVITCSYKSTSFYGNPSYWVLFEYNGEKIKGYTASDASCGYGCTNFNGGKECEISFHYTKKGNVIINHMHKPENK